MRLSRQTARVLLALLVAMSACSAPTSPKQVTTTGVVVTGLPATSIFVGDAIQLTATAIFSDGSTKVVTTIATWSTTNVTVFSVSSSGLLTAIGIGTASVAATYDGQSAAQTTTVEAAVTGESCGLERWPVKTLSDPNATMVDLLNPQTTTISALNQFTPHCSGIPSLRTYAEEFKAFEVSGKILVVRSEDDRDYHIALQDLSNPSVTIVTEIADPSCEGAISSPYRQLLGQTRNAFNAIIAGRSLSTMIGETLRIRGVGFYDFNHGQTGRSVSCLELHPVISVEKVQ